MTPAWRMAPPRRWRSTRASAMTSAGPARTEPTGAQRPFERQDITVVTGAVKAAAGVPVATSALKSRAPSMWMGRPPAAAARASEGGQRSRGRRPAGMWVCSTQTSSGTG